MVVPREEAKSEVAQQLWLALLEQGFTRHDAGNARRRGDVGPRGWVASTYKRGMRLWQPPTTIIGMVDAAIGGKSALNLGEVKNAMGTFYPAEKGATSTRTGTPFHGATALGLGQVLKYALLGMVPRAGVWALNPSRHTLLCPHRSLSSVPKPSKS